MTTPEATSPPFNQGPLLDEAGVRRTITRLAHEIVEGNAGLEGLVLVGLQTRGATLAQRIADAMVDELERFLRQQRDEQE